MQTPLCTLISHPTRPEHCITYASAVLWEKSHANHSLDVDDAEHVRWVHEKALERARRFGIEPFSLEITRVPTLRRIDA